MHFLMELLQPLTVILCLLGGHPLQHFPELFDLEVVQIVGQLVSKLSQSSRSRRREVVIEMFSRRWVKDGWIVLHLF